MRVLFQLAKQAALLKLHVESLQGAINGLVGLDGNVNQKLKCLRKTSIMAQTARNVAGYADKLIRLLIILDANERALFPASAI